ncbi:MAG: hypothetical protein M0Q53_07435 [Prolixibacteraceae bacterium]|jgi:hypothetical protein|nr:hypothetical protein [Prolixibacteraceae bacterium]
MEYVYKGASIECDGAEIISRKINFGSLVNIPDLGNCRKYSCERNSETTIEKELTPKIPIRRGTSYLDLGDKLKADSIVVYIKRASNIKIHKIDKSHRHNAQLANTDVYTHAEITEIFPNMKILNNLIQTFPPPKKLLKEVNDGE